MALMRLGSRNVSANFNVTVINGWMEVYTDNFSIFLFLKQIPLIELCKVYNCNAVSAF